MEYAEAINLLQQTVTHIQELYSHILITLAAILPLTSFSVEGTYNWSEWE